MAKTIRGSTKFEVMWYEGATVGEAIENDRRKKVFYTRKKAFAFYEEHRDDGNKFGWCIAKKVTEYIITDER